MKLGDVVVHMHTTTSPSFIKIGLKTKSFISVATCNVVGNHATNHWIILFLFRYMVFLFLLKYRVRAFNTSPNEPTEYLIVKLSLLASTFQENQDFHLLLLLFKAYDEETQLHLTRPTHHYPIYGAGAAAGAALVHNLLGYYCWTTEKRSVRDRNPLI